jgi:hypothetical protein
MINWETREDVPDFNLKDGNDSLPFHFGCLQST